MIVADDAGPELRRHVAVEEDDRDVHLGQRSSVAGVPFAGERQDQAVHAARLEESDVRDVERRLVLRVHQEHRVAGRPQDGLGARAVIVAISGFEMSPTT